MVLSLLRPVSSPPSGRVSLVAWSERGGEDIFSALHQCSLRLSPSLSEPCLPLLLHIYFIGGRRGERLPVPSCCPSPSFSGRGNRGKETSFLLLIECLEWDRQTGRYRKQTNRGAYINIRTSHVGIRLEREEKFVVGSNSFHIITIVTNNLEETGNIIVKRSCCMLQPSMNRAQNSLGRERSFYVVHFLI